MKTITLFISLFLISTLSAQNVQLHYDFGKPENGDSRDFFVSTFEFFRPDSLGKTFLFADFEFNAKKPVHGVSSGYFEISREFYIPWFKHYNYLRDIGFHMEYNGGSAIKSIDSVKTIGYNLTKSWLTGFSFPVRIKNFSLSTILLYKYTPESESNDIQVTLVWFQMLFKHRVVLDGFADFWTNENENGRKDLVIYSEPQIWFNVYRKFSIGSEFKISYNFIPGSERVEVFPTLGVKYDF